MSGLLRRLAGQAMGLASPVRTVAHLPFAPAPALIEETLPSAVLDDRPGPERFVPPSIEERKAPSETDRPLPAADERSAAPLVPAAAGPEWQPPGQVPIVQARVPAAGAGDGPPRPPVYVAQGPLVHVAQEVRRPGARTTPIVASVPAVSGVPWARALPDDPVVDGEVRERFPLPPTVVPPLPQPFEAAVAAGAGVRAGPGLVGPGPRADRAGAVEEITEVHVSIGRIEVTAVHEAPRAPERRAPAQRKAMSLDEYLARRQKGRP